MNALSTSIGYFIYFGTQFALACSRWFELGCGM